MSLESIPKSILSAGGKLAAIAYNIAQSARLTPEDRVRIDGARMEWDAAIEEVHAAERFGAAPIEFAVPREQALEDAIATTLKDIADAAEKLPIPFAGYALLPLQSHLSALLKQRADLLARGMEAFS